MPEPPLPKKVTNLVGMVSFLAALDTIRAMFLFAFLLNLPVAFAGEKQRSSGMLVEVRDDNGVLQQSSIDLLWKNGNENGSGDSCVRLQVF